MDASLATKLCRSIQCGAFSPPSLYLHCHSCNLHYVCILDIAALNVHKRENLSVSDVRHVITSVQWGLGVTAWRCILWVGFSCMWHIICFRTHTHYQRSMYAVLICQLGHMRKIFLVWLRRKTWAFMNFNV